LNNELKRLALFEITGMKKNKKTSFISEIASIQSSLKGMNMGVASFSKFVPFSVVKRIVGGDQTWAKLGVQKREVTVMFVDIADFATFMEKWPQEKVMLLLEEYLTAMISVIEGKGGTIGDCIGDCIMAFWNSPSDQPEHAQLAVDTAFAMKKKLGTWNQIWVKRGLPKFRIQIGINTGEALSGNIGSPAKMKFGVVGDTVNHASRIENLNKFYGSSCLLNESTYESIKHSTLCRPVDKVAVKGRQAGTLIYELIAPKDSVNVKKLQHIVDDTTEMLSLYWERNFDKVVDKAERYLFRHSKDLIVARLQEKAKAYTYNPPESNWDGVNRMTKK